MSDPTLAHWRQSTRGSGALYSALNQDRQEIRHLTVYSGGFNDEIRCKLTPVSLTQKPAYTALSYCWGDANDCVEITIDDQKIAVTKSLETALRYLRSSQEDVVAWVDAICINQRDLDEKSNQVRMMGNIYANGKWWYTHMASGDIIDLDAASHVRIWLGESAENSDVAMDFISRIHTVDFDDPDFVLDPNTWEAVKRLFRRKWWTRQWVVQEALLAKDPKVYCGRKVAGIESFAQLKRVETKYRHGYGPRLRPLQSALAGPFGTILLDWEDRKSEIANGGIRLPQMITMTGESQCTVRLDKIFALLSMCAKVDRLIIHIDYNDSVRQLMTKVAKYLLIEREIHNPLFVLQTHQAGKDPTLPSWVPDYTTEDFEGHLIRLRSKEGEPFAAGADNAAWTSLGLAGLPNMVDSYNSYFVRIEDEGSFETLVLDGLVVDVVSAAFETPWIDLYEGFDLEEDARVKLRRRELITAACKDWESYVNQLPPERDPYKRTCGRYEAFWRTLVTDRDFDYTCSPSLAQDFAARFEAWMGRGGDKKKGDEAYSQPFNRAVIPYCMHRSFLVTEKGYLGLGRCDVRVDDVVCVLRGGAVPFVLRRGEGGYWRFEGEAYVHGIMDGSYVRGARKEELREFRVR